MIECIGTQSDEMPNNEKKGKKYRTKTRYGAGDFTSITVEIDLKPKDAKRSACVALAEKAKTSLEESLIGRCLRHQDDRSSGRDLTLAVKIVRSASESTRERGIFRSERGVGWVVLSLEWNILDANGNILAGPFNGKYRFSGQIGDNESCEDDFGTKAILRMAAYDAPQDILPKFGMYCFEGGSTN